MPPLHGDCDELTAFDRLQALPGARAHQQRQPELRTRACAVPSPSKPPRRCVLTFCAPVTRTNESDRPSTSLASGRDRPSGGRRNGSSAGDAPENSEATPPTSASTNSAKTAAPDADASNAAASNGTGAAAPEASTSSESETDTATASGTPAPAESILRAAQSFAQRLASAFSGNGSAEKLEEHKVAQSSAETVASDKASSMPAAAAAVETTEPVAEHEATSSSEEEEVQGEEEEDEFELTATTHQSIDDVHFRAVRMHCLTSHNAHMIKTTA